MFMFYSGEQTSGNQIVSFQNHLASLFSALFGAPNRWQCDITVLPLPPLPASIAATLMKLNAGRCCADPEFRMRLWILLFYIGGEIVVAALNFALCFFEEAFKRWQTG